MEDLLVTEFIDIELERFELHAEFMWNVFDANGGKIWKARARTKAGELRAGELDRIAPHQRAIFKALELVIADGDFAVELLIFSIICRHL